MAKKAVTKKKRGLIAGIIIAAAAVAVLIGVFIFHRRTGGNVELIGKNLNITESTLFSGVDTDKINRASIEMNAGSLKGQTITLTKKKNGEDLSSVADAFFRSGNRYAAADDTSFQEGDYVYRITFTMSGKDKKEVTIAYYNDFTIRYNDTFYYQVPSINNKALNTVLEKYHAGDKYNYFP